MSTAKSYYNNGLSHYEKGQYENAIADYTKAIELDPSKYLLYDRLLLSDIETTMEGEFVFVKIGGIDWRVLDVKNNQALLLSELVLKANLYHSEDEYIKWKNCALRQYLNNDFYNKFSDNDRSRIAKKTIPNKNNQWYGTPGGNDTTDNIFLLSLEEVIQYFGDSGRLKYPLNEKNKSYHYYLSDEFNDKRIAMGRSGLTNYWWLRSPGRNNDRAAYVNYEGHVIVSGDVVSEFGGVRPALWLNL
ncbi:MAG: tetratricopeptide repeat protein [Defluviitaleaceae bacterium]|nr:tetratricopeptide repeat protein [Defluviitaleaceae bacterium]